MINAGEVELLDEVKLQEQLLTLVLRGAKIDHEPGGHDDYANVLAGLVFVIRQAALDYNVHEWNMPIVTSSGPRYYPGSDTYGGGNMMRVVIPLPD